MLAETSFHSPHSLIFQTTWIRSLGNKKHQHNPVIYSTCHKWCKRQTCAFRFGPVVSGSLKRIFSRNNTVPCPKHWMMHCAIEEATGFEDCDLSLPLQVSVECTKCKNMQNQFRIFSSMVNVSPNVKRRHTNRHMLKMTSISMTGKWLWSTRCVLGQLGVSLWSPCFICSTYLHLCVMWIRINIFSNFSNSRDTDHTRGSLATQYHSFRAGKESACQASNTPAVLETLGPAFCLS